MKTPANFAITCAITVNLAWLLLVPASHATAADDAGIAAVKALLSRKCLSCHHGEDAKGKLDFTSRESLLTGGESGPALVASSPEKSPLWQRIEQDEMPPKHPLAADEKRLIKIGLPPEPSGPVRDLIRCSPVPTIVRDLTGGRSNRFRLSPFLPATWQPHVDSRSMILWRKNWSSANCRCPPRRAARS